MERSASAASFSDWDGDGDLDMLVGNIQGELYWNRNEGTAQAFRFTKRKPLEVNGHPLSIPSGDAHPVAADWNGDGAPDLLAAGGGGVMLWLGRRSGPTGPPALQAGQRLSAGGKPIGFGHRVKLCVCDWNGDGRLDLLAGTNVRTQSGQDSGNVWVMLREE